MTRTRAICAVSLRQLSFLFLLN